MPAALAVAAVNAAVPRTAISLPALAARQHAATAAAAAAERRVQERYGMPTLRLSDDENVLMLLCEWAAGARGIGLSCQPLPAAKERGRAPAHK